MKNLNLTPQSEIATRVKKLQSKLAEKDIDGALIIHHTNMFYFSGTSQNGFLFIPQKGDPVLMIKRSFNRAKLESPIENIVELKSPKLIVETLEAKGFTLHKLALELDMIPYNTVLYYQKVLQKELIDVSGLIKQIRIIKSDYEIDLLKKACEALDSNFADVPGMVQIGMTEVELAGRFEAGLRKRGYGGCSKMHAFNQDFFMGNIVTGPSGAAATYFDGPVGGTGVTPANNPHGAGWRTIQNDNIIYIDYTSVIDGYTADGSRMFVFGKVSDTIKKGHEAALQIQSELIEIIKPGISCETIYETAMKKAEELNLLENFMGLGKDKVKFIGHGVGLELDELPVFAPKVQSEIQPGMTFALEPKFVFPEGAVGIENTFVLREDGVEKLTNAPEEIVSC